MKLISIIATLNKVEGHEFGYHLALRKAAHTNGWEHIALIPKAIFLPGQPKEWLPILPHRKKWLFKPLRKWLYILSHARNLGTVLDDHSIIFYERFSHEELTALYLALKLSRKHPKVWLFYRVLPQIFRKHEKRHKQLQEKIAKRAPLQLFGDTDLLLQALEMSFGKKVIELPIPHTCQRQSPENSKELLLWWPGGMREEKGLIHIQRLARNPSKMRLIITEEMKPHLVDAKMSITWLPKNLPQEEYEQWMSKIDVVLLPYIPNVHYQGSSSGILVEAVVAGKLPLGSDGTWIAHELRKFGLEELIIDWERDIQIENLIHNAKIKANLEKMREVYAAFHCPQTFAKVLKSSL